MLSFTDTVVDFSELSDKSLLFFLESSSVLTEYSISCHIF